MVEQVRRTLFKIPIGDWSDDGHGKVEHYIASSAKSIQDVREAYFSGVASLDRALSPERLVSDYGCRTVPLHVANEVLGLSGISLGAGPPEEYVPGEGVWVDIDQFVDYVVWVINRGDPSVDVRLEPSVVTTLPFYGYDSKNRHIGFMGYGLFE